MTSTVTEHCGGDREPQTGTFRTMAELRDISFVAWWAKQDGFSRFALWPASVPRGPDHYLMAEMTDGKSWVVGFVTGGKDADDFTRDEPIAFH